MEIIKKGDRLQRLTNHATEPLELGSAKAVVPGDKQPAVTVDS